MTLGLDAFMLGRREWIALPELGLVAIKAKVDTGAKTSALDADNIALLGNAPYQRVRFVVHPISEKPEIAVTCETDVVGLRRVTSSSGEVENRIIIKTPIKVGERIWSIEVGLTNRQGMAHRMLLGRQAIIPGMLIDPTHSFVQPKLSPSLYRRQALADF